MLIDWWKTRSTVRAINSAILQHGKIKVAKAKDRSRASLHWYCFSTIDERFERKVRGSGADFSDQMGIVRAWGEFVERYSFRQTVNADATVATSNGFASHISREQAKESALAELVERDVFLSSWLLHYPASEIDLQAIDQPFEILRLKRICKDGFEIKMGILGECMGFLVGIVVVYSHDKFVIATAAKRTMSGLISNLTREAAVAVTDLTSPKAPQPIEKLSENAEPMDHLKYYLSFPAKEFLKNWVDPGSKVRPFPAFRYTLDDLTSTNELAGQTGYFVYRAKSDECQNLWFGTTRPAVVNLDRLSQIAGHPISYEEVNHEPHPLA